MERAFPAAVVVTSALMALTLASAGHNRVVGDCTHSQVRPTSITLACADDYTSVSDIQWTRFGGATASGKGEFNSNPCTPNCAASKEQVTPITFTLSQAKRCPGGANDYRLMSITFGATPPKTYGRHYYPKLYCPIP